MSDSEVVPEGEPPPRLYLHIGLPKSGSTFLQSLLGGNRSALKENGYIYPYVRQEGMFHAALEMAGKPASWGLTPEAVEGTFGDLLARGRRFGGRVVISHEIFSAASAQQVQAIAERLDDFEVHVVVTVRNLGRVVTAQWQERVKNGHPDSFAEFSDGVLADLPDGESGGTSVFWRGQDLAALLARWAVVAPPERTHVVVTPGAGAGPDGLWNRFATAIDLPPGLIDPATAPQGNESLGAAQVAFLRQTLGALDGRLEQPWYAVVAKRWFAQSVLGTVRSRKAVTPAPVAERLAVVARSWIDLVRTGGYPVYGDLDELLPEIAPPGTPEPDDVTPAEIVDGLPDAVALMLLRARDDRAAIQALEAENELLTAQVAGLTEAAENRRWWRRN